MKESLKLYKTLLILFFVLVLALVYVNMNLINNFNLRKTYSVSSNNIMKPIPKKYGYSEILDILNKDKNLEIININIIKEKQSFVEVDLRYLGKLEELYLTLESLKSEDCVASIEKIKINKTGSEIKDITFKLMFFKDK